MRVAIVGAALAAATVLAASSIEAQTHRAHLGARASYNFDAEEFGLGAQLGVPIARRLEFYPSFDYYFVSPGSLWALNADLKYRVSATSSAEWLYVGGGVNFTGFSGGGASNTDVGANLFVGGEPLRGKVHPFAEGRLTLGSGSSFQISAGFNITI